VQETEIKGVIDRITGPPTSAVMKDLDDLKLKGAFLACWLSPRKLDADLAAAPIATPAETAGRAQMAKLWSSVDQCALYLASSEGLELGVSMTYRAEALPPEARSQFATAPVISSLWRAIPDDAIFALAGRIEANALIDLLASFLPLEEKPKLRQQIERELGAVVGKDKLSSVLAGIGPDVGLWAVRSGHNAGSLPLVTAAMQVRREPDLTVPATVRRTLDFYVQSLVVDYNRNHEHSIAYGSEVRQTAADLNKIEITILNSPKLFPPGVSPAFALKDNYLVVGSHPKAIEDFPASTEHVHAGDIPILRISGIALRKQIGDHRHRDQLSKFFATLQDRDAAAIGKDLDTLATVLEAIDRAEVVVRGDSRSRTFALKVKFVKPLK